MYLYIQISLYFIIQTAIAPCTDKMIYLSLAPEQVKSSMWQDQEGCSDVVDALIGEIVIEYLA